MHHSNIIKYQRGISLIEIMIVMTLSISLTALLFETYLASHRTYQMQVELKHLQDNAMTAIEILTQEIKQAGYIGCQRLRDDKTVSGYLSYELNPTNKIQVINGKEITLQYAEFPAATLLQPMQNQLTLYVNSEVTFKPQEILIISDCKYAEMFEVKEVHTSKGMQIITASQSLKRNYSTNAEISKFAINHFYIDKTNRKHADGSSIYALYIDDIHHIKSEMVEDIQSMKLNETEEGVSIQFQVLSGSLKKNWYRYVSFKEPIV